MGDKARETIGLKDLNGLLAAAKYSVKQFYCRNKCLSLDHHIKTDHSAKGVADQIVHIKQTIRALEDKEQSGKLTNLDQNGKCNGADQNLLFAKLEAISEEHTERNGHHDIEYNLQYLECAEIVRKVMSHYLKLCYKLLSS